MQSIFEKPEKGLEPFIPEFIVNRYLDLEKLESFIFDQNFDSIAKLAHSWKGFSRPYGFLNLEILAFKLEDELKVKNLDGCKIIAKDIRIYLKSKE